jgi:hypothetical protein
MRAHLLKYAAASVALLSGFAFLALDASVAQASVTIGRGVHRSGDVVGTGGAGVIVVALILSALVVAGLVWAIQSDRHLVVAARSSGEPRHLPEARGDDKADETRKAA